MTVTRRWAIIFTHNALGTTFTRCVETTNLTVTMARKAAEDYARKQPEYQRCKYYEVHFICEYEMHELTQLTRRFMDIMERIMGKVEA